MTSLISPRISSDSFRKPAHCSFQFNLHLPVPKRGPYVALQVPHRYPWSEILPGRLGPLVPKRWSVRFITRRVVRAAHRAGLAVHA